MIDKVHVAGEMVEVARVERNPAATISLLHQPVAPGLCTVTALATPAAPPIGEGASNFMGNTIGFWLQVLIPWSVFGDGGTSTFVARLLDGEGA